MDSTLPIFSYEMHTPRPKPARNPFLDPGAAHTSDPGRATMPGTSRGGQASEDRAAEPQSRNANEWVTINLSDIYRYSNKTGPNANANANANVHRNRDVEAGRAPRSRSTYRFRTVLLGFLVVVAFVFCVMGIVIAAKRAHKLP